MVFSQFRVLEEYIPDKSLSPEDIWMGFCSLVIGVVCGSCILLASVLEKPILGLFLSFCIGLKNFLLPKLNTNWSPSATPTGKTRNEANQNSLTFPTWVPGRGVEPPRLAAQLPQSCVYTVSPPGPHIFSPIIAKALFIFNFFLDNEITLGK